MTLEQWAIKHHVSAVALADLKQSLGLELPASEPTKSESRVQSECRLTASQAGGLLLRNNVGAGTLDNGQYLRWGLANDSKRLNTHVKSGDLIGIWPLLITPEHLGLTIGQFWSVEVKGANWTYSGTEHEQAQARWAQLVIAHGGRAQFCNNARLLTAPTK